MILIAAWRRTALPSLLVLLVLLSACAGPPVESPESEVATAGSSSPALPDIPEDAAYRRTLALAEQELEVVRLLLDLNAAHRPVDADLLNVRVVDPAAGTASEPTCVSVRGGRIAAVGTDCPPNPGIQQIDGAGRYLVPGLADMHVHQLESAMVPLLNVLFGVTTVRDMDGFPWLLEWREKAAGDQLFAPSMYVTGRILNFVPYGWYTREVKTPEEGRVAVREQAAAGYDAIKIHNVLPLPIFDAVLDEARRMGLDVVGHVPHEISVEHAIESGMWTMEHFKGYVDDRSLQISDEDWVTPTRGAEAWNCPTLYTERERLRGAARDAWFESAEARWVPVLRRDAWRRGSEEPVGEPHAGLAARQRQVLERLLPITDRFLAGTDSGGGYPFMVSGPALHDELANFQDAGMSPPLALRTATTHAAAALRWEGESGVIAPGARADLLLVADNPLDDVRHLRAIEGVMLRGAWIDGVERSEILDRLAAIQARVPAVAGDAAVLDDDWAERLVAEVEALRADGYTHPVHLLEEWAAALEEAGFGEEAERLSASNAPPN